MINTPPILYSFRRCPYAMRARLALYYANIKCELREVVLNDKPDEMIRLSAKATVPVLHLPNGQVIDQSYDIIKWAIRQNDPGGWRMLLEQTDELVAENDGPFKSALDNYKYACSSPEHPPEFYRSQGEGFLKKLDGILRNAPYLLGDHQTVADIALFPFIRQFAHVDRDWFYTAPYPCLHRWLNRHLNSDIFGAIMNKYPKWHAGDDSVYFPDLRQVTHSSLGAFLE